VTTEVAVREEEDILHKIINLKAEGKNLTQIAKILGISRPAVVDYWELFKETAVNSNSMKGRAKEALASVDVHFDRLIAELHSVISDIDDHAISEGIDPKFLGHKISAIGKITDIEAKRVQMLKEAGLLEDQQVANQILEAERKTQIVADILRDVTSKCDHCRIKVAERLSQLRDEPVEIKVVRSESV
jgi:biotin operon repressor